MKRLIGVKELRDLLENSPDIYEVVDVINASAKNYVFTELSNIIQKEANSAARKLKARAEVSKKLKTNKKTFLKL